MKYWKIYLALILLVNFILRLFIYYKTSLFSFSDYQSYIGAIDLIYNKGHINFSEGNFLFGISYLGYFFKYILGNLDYFFWFNCALGTLTTFLISLLVIKVTRNYYAGVVTAVILSVYTEYLVFTSVFYTPALMIFILSILVLLTYYYFHSVSFRVEIIYLTLICSIFIASFFLKPELIFLPIFLVILSIIMARNKKLFRKNSFLTLTLLTGILIVLLSGIYSKKEDEVIVNDFVFFGHTDYGGDGGEGAFIYPENKTRYDKAWQDYCISNNLNKLTPKDRNRFQILEVKKFIFQHPVKWVKLQFTKFFRTFGVVPESTSFKVLYTGLFKDRLWLTSIVVVAPVAIIILMFIVFFNSSTFTLLSFNEGGSSTLKQSPPHTGFYYVYFTIFIYYLIATIFFGHYQERYRIPVLVVFVIPLLGYFISVFNKKEFFSKTSFTVKSILILLFLTIWIFQARKAISNNERLKNVLETIENQIDN